jgi:hypothetical protein
MSAPEMKALRKVTKREADGGTVDEGMLGKPTVFTGAQEAKDFWPWVLSS